MVTKYENPALGYIAIFLGSLTSAISFVFIAHLNQTHNEMLSIAITFGYAAILFNLLNLNRAKNLYSSVASNFKLISRMNFVTLINWLCTFFSFNYIDPATAICISFSMITVTLFFILTPLNKISKNKHLVFSILLILASMALIIKQHADVTLHANYKMIGLGVFWSVLGGITGAYIGIYSEGMSKAGFSVTQILATRFYLLVAISSFAFLIIPHSTPIVIDWKYYLFATLIIVFFPLIMYQTAIARLGPVIVSLLEPFIPVLTYVFQTITGDNEFNFLTISLLGISSIAIIWFVRIEQKLAREKNLLRQENTLEQAINAM
jgi:drug/metabolite transporter (DMT)-like permease